MENGDISGYLHILHMENRDVSILHMPAQQNFALCSIRVANIVDMIWIIILKIIT